MAINRQQIMGHSSMLRVDGLKLDAQASQCDEVSRVKATKSPAIADENLI